MPGTTITLKLSAERKRALQRAARARRKSVNAYILACAESLSSASADIGDASLLDHEKLSAHLSGRFAGMEAWRLVPERE